MQGVELFILFECKWAVGWQLINFSSLMPNILYEAACVELIEGVYAKRRQIVLFKLDEWVVSSHYVEVNMKIQKDLVIFLVGL